VSYDVIITKVQETLAKLPKPTIKPGTVHSDFKSLVIPGPNFASKSPPMQHEGNVARFYTTISLVVWVFLRSDYVKTHFPRSYDPNLAAPREVISLAKDYVSGQRKPDIAVMHRPPPDSNLPLKPRWPQIACIGM
jgi:hypothetical protein